MRSVSCVTVILLLGLSLTTSAQEKPSGPLEAAGRAVKNATENRRAKREMIEKRLREARENQDAYRQRIESNLLRRLTPQQREEARELAEEAREQAKEAREERRERLEEARDDAEDDLEDWQDWSNRRHAAYREWYRGPWRGPIATSAGKSWWEYRWSRYPSQTALGIGPWTVNRGAFAFGIREYHNPFYTPTVGGATVVIDYGRPLYTYEVPVNPAVSGALAFTESRRAFMNRDYVAALRFIDAAVQTNPGDAVIHEFRSLVLFALKQYDASAMAAYAVLASGPPWNYETLLGLYPDEGTYLGHLQQLERTRADHSDSPSARFLLAYHYLVKEDYDAASRELEAFLRLVPNDLVGVEMLVMVGGKIPEKASVLAKRDAAIVIEPAMINGTWRSANDRGYELHFKENGEFVWGRRGTQKPIEGVYVLNGSQVILQSDDGGVVIANVIPSANGQYSITIGDDDAVQLQIVR